MICFQPDVGQDSFLTRMNRGLCCHMCPIWTNATNLFVSVITGNSFRSLSVRYQANTDSKTIQIQMVPKSESCSKLNKDTCVLSLALPPLPSSCSLPSSSASSSPLLHHCLTLLMLQAFSFQLRGRWIGQTPSSSSMHIVSYLSTAAFITSCLMVAG